MSWRDNYRQASFRGAQFWVEAHDASGGRRVAVHQYPGRDVPYTEDMGELAKGFALTAYVATTPDNDDYMPERDTLIKALRQKGPGELVHPYLGAMRVQNFSWSLREVRENGGIAVFDLSFGEAGAATAPSVARSAAAGMQAKAESAMEAAKESFASQFCVQGKADYLRDEASLVLDDLGDLYQETSRLAGIATQVANILATFTDILGRVSDAMEIADSIVSLPRAISSAFEEPWRKYRNIDGTYRGSASMRGGPLEANVVTTLLHTKDFALDTPMVQYATATRLQQIANQSAIGALVRQSAVIEAARVAPFVNWRTLDHAESARDVIADVLDAEMEVTIDDDMFRALFDLRIAVIKSVPPENAQLPYLVEYATNRTLPALCLSYTLYGNIEQEEEIVYLNRLRHPGFIPGGETLKVLTRV